MAKHLIIALLILIINAEISPAQRLSGNLNQHAGQELTLHGFWNFETVDLAKTTVDSSGNFIMIYPDSYKGMGYLEAPGNARLFLVLNELNAKIFGTNLQQPDSIRFENSPENEIFNLYAEEHNQREAALAGWKYLLPQYKESKLLTGQHAALQAIQDELQRIENEDRQFLQQIDKSTYISWFLPVRKLIDDMPASAQRYTERIPKHIADFRNMNLDDWRLQTSGILGDLLEGHYWLLENSGKPLDSIYVEMNRSTGHVINSIRENTELLNEACTFLFKLMERRSLFKASEYLAVSLLTDESCVLEDNLAKQLETYKAMKKGNIAPELIFSEKKVMSGFVLEGDMIFEDLGFDKTLVVFGASWCQRCKEDIPKIKAYYNKWKEKGLDVIFISLDTDEKAFTDFVAGFPWFSYCDFQEWESPPVKEYYVFSTPTMFLLDTNREILLRPISAAQVDAWVDVNLSE